MKVFFIRHGKDDGNYRGGWSAMPLLDEGKEQVKKLAQYLGENSKEFNIEKIISSDLERTKETTEIINKKLGAEVEYTDRLREMNNGKIAGMLNEEVEKKFPGLYYNTLRMDERYPDGESPIEFHDRIIKSFKEIIEENKNHENIMIVTHSGVINIIYRYINNMEWSNKIKSVKISNASIYSLVIDGDKKYFELENFCEYL